MIMLADSEGPDQPVQADLGLCYLHMPKDMFSYGTALYELFSTDQSTCVSASTLMPGNGFSLACV